MFGDNKVRRFFSNVLANIRISVKRGSFSLFFAGENFTIAIHLENELCFVTLLFFYSVIIIV